MYVFDNFFPAKCSLEFFLLSPCMYVYTYVYIVIKNGMKYTYVFVNFFHLIMDCEYLPVFLNIPLQELHHIPL